MKEWILVDCDFRSKLPKQDCDIWITRIWFTGERWVQKVKFYADNKDIEWDGTVAWLVANEGDDEPEPYTGVYVTTVQNVR